MQYNQAPSCISSVTSYAESGFFHQTMNFRLKKAKIKRGLLDYAAYTKLINFDQLSKVFKENKVKLTNPNQAKNFFSITQNKLSVDAIMSMLEAKESDKNEATLIELKIPTSIRQHFEHELREAQLKDLKIPQIPERRTNTQMPPNPRKYVEFNTNPTPKGDRIQLQRNFTQDCYGDEAPFQRTFHGIIKHDRVKSQPPRRDGGESEKSKKKAQPTLNLTSNIRTPRQCKTPIKGERNVTPRGGERNTTPRGYGTQERARTPDITQLRRGQETLPDLRNTTIDNIVSSYPEDAPYQSQTLIPNNPDTQPPKRSTSKIDFDPEFESKVQPMCKELQNASVNYKFLFELVEELYMCCDRKFNGGCDKEKFIRQTGTLRRCIGYDVFDKIVEMCTTSDSQIKCNRLSKLVDEYKYSQPMIRKNKNDSQQFIDHAHYGIYVNNKSTVTQSSLERNYAILQKKIEEKFKRITQAYRFFDGDKSNGVGLTEFKAGLDYLSLRFPDDQMEELFNFLDRKGDGLLDHDEFCDILEERKLLKGNIVVNYDPITGKVRKQKQFYSEHPFINYMNVKKDGSIHSELGSVKTSAFKSHAGGINLEKIKQFSKQILTKQGFDKSQYDDTASQVSTKSKMRSTSSNYRYLPSDLDKNYRYGQNNKPSERMRDLFQHNYEKEYIEKKIAAEIRRAIKREEDHQKKKSRLNAQNATSILRKMKIDKDIEKNYHPESMFKKSRHGEFDSEKRSRNSSASVMNRSFFTPKKQTTTLQHEKLNTSAFL